MMLCSSFAACFYPILNCMCAVVVLDAAPASKSTPITAVDEPTNGLKIQGKAVQKPRMYEDYWSTSTADIDISAIQYQRSFASLSASNLMQGPNAFCNDQFEFVNHGFSLRRDFCTSD